MSVREKKSNGQVVIIGTMHFNPGSINTVEKVVSGLAQNKSLSSVVVELCPGRYRAMEKAQPKGSQLRKLLDNEMQAAVDAAKESGLERIILGDSSDKELVERLTAVVQKTFKDIASPLDGGWQSILRDFQRLYVSLSGPPKLDEARIEGLKELVHPKYGMAPNLQTQMLMGTPVALMRNLVTLSLKLPAQLSAVMMTSYATILAAAHSQPTQPGDTLRAGSSSSSLFDKEILHSEKLIATDSLVSTQNNALVQASIPSWNTVLDAITSTHFPTPVAVLSLGILANVVLATLLARVAAVVLLLERDEILARSIRKAAEQASKTNKTVVAVLGMAHCNGVARRLAGDITELQ